MGHPRSTDLALLQGAFATVGDELARRYVALHDGAPDGYERQCWLERVIDLRECKRAVAATDPDALSRCIAEWSQVLDGLRRMDP
ncbi:hypothetical protein SUDANB121_00880 [Nocardiopsis dassonvillei]